MAYQIRFEATIAWVGDGANQMSVPGAQALRVRSDYPLNQVPGGDAPSTANITTACTTGATNLAALLNAQIGTIQGWNSGSP